MTRLEDLTRKELIDPVLNKAGWHSTRIQREAIFYYDSEHKTVMFRADYVLFVDHHRYGRTHTAIIEAKKESLPPDYGLAQGQMYADVLAKNVRFVFSTNGHEFVQYDRMLETVSAPAPMENFPRYEMLHGLIQKVSEVERRIDKDAYTLERYVRDVPLDGNKEVVVHAIAKLLLPKEDVRTKCFNVFADSLLFVNSIGTGKWETTLASTGQYIRLNVGRLEVMAVFRQGIHIILDEDQLTAADFFKIEKYAFLSDSRVYASVESSIACNFRAEDISLVMPIILKAHKSLLKLAANSVKENTVYRQYQSAGVIDYLRKLTKREIPHPKYM